MKTRNYSYGAKPPRGGLNVVAEQMSLGHRYYNQLIELERASRQRYREVRRSISPKYESLEQQLADVSGRIELAIADIGKRNAAERKRRATAEEQAALKQLKAERKSLNERLKSARETLKSSAALTLAADGLTDWKKSRHKELRSQIVAQGLPWGTYQIVEDAWMESRSGKTDPRFRRWTGDGCVAVHIQNRVLTVEDALACTDSRLRIDASTQWATVQMRIGSEGRAPVWATVAVRLHRPLPPKSTITWAKLFRRIVGGEDHWSVVFTLGIPDSDEQPAERSCDMAGVDVGWSLQADGGLRVAFWKDSNGDSGEWKLPAEWLSADRKIHALASQRADQWNTFRPFLSGWLAANTHPEWLKEATAALAHWKHAGRLKQILRRWSDERFPGDNVMFAETTTYFKNEQHLYREERHLEKKNAARRRDYYRKESADLSGRCRHIAVEDINWRELKRLPAPEENDRQAAARHWSKFAAPGELRECLMLRHEKLIQVDPRYTTLRCHACGGLCAFDASKFQTHRCERCGAEWDQDYNAAANILCLGQLALDDGSWAARETERQRKKEDAKRNNKRRRKKSTDGDEPLAESA